MRQRYIKFFNEENYPQVDVGDEVLGGKFKNKRMIVKDFGTDDIGQPTIITDKGEKKLYAVRIPVEEEMLDGQVMGFFADKATIWRIESTKEFKQMGRWARGIIVNSELYMTSGRSSVIHHEMIEYLIRVQKIKFPSGDRNASYYVKYINKFLCIQVDNQGFCRLGESYPEGPILIPLEKWQDNKPLTKNETFIINSIQQHFKVLDKLNIPYKFVLM